MSVRIKNFGLNRLVWSAHLQKQGRAAEQQPIGSLPLEEETPKQSPFPWRLRTWRRMRAQYVKGVGGWSPAAGSGKQLPVPVIGRPSSHAAAMAHWAPRSTPPMECMVQPAIKVQKVTPADNPKAFLSFFECTGTIAG